MMRTRLPLAVSLLACGLAAQAATFSPDAIFASHMALPAATDVPLHGRGPAGAAVVVEPSWGAAVRCVVGADGRWQVVVQTGVRGAEGELLLRCGDAEQVLEDVVFGDVWLASGQSNMEMRLGASMDARRGDNDATAVVAAADHPDLRVFTVARRAAVTSGGDVSGSWQRCTPEVAEKLSAVGYYFARDLLRAGKGPLGLVVSSWGGTPVQAWTSPDALMPFDEYAAALAAQRGASDDAGRLAAQRERFFAAIGAKVPAAASVEVKLPERWSQTELRDFDGAVDYVRKLTLPAAFVGKELQLELGAIDDMDQVLWNGARVAGSERDGVWNQARRYRIPAAKVTTRDVELCLRVVDTGGEGGFTGAAAALRLLPVDGSAEPLPLAGRWRRTVRAKIGDLPRWPQRGGGGGGRPAVLWRGMIEPLLPFPFTGAIWYQGESNRGQPDLYAKVFPAMIRDWRARIGTRLPFYFVQIAPFGYRNDVDDQVARLRQAQASALALSDTGMAVTLDSGNCADIHPHRKAPVGGRLALLARRDVYGDDVIAAAPFATGVERLDGALHVAFTPARPLRIVGVPADGGFEVAGADGRFVPARASFRDGRLVVANDAVAAPVQVRYAWSACPPCRLVDGLDLPVAPFALRIAR